MPEGTRVERCFRKLKAKKRSKAVNPAAVCQDATGQSLKTGQALAEVHSHCDCGGKCQECKAAEKFSEGNASLHEVEIFRSGKHRDKEYTDADLDDMVENFKNFSSGDKPALRVPGVLGHEEEQEYLERSDLPAAAWATRLYRDGHVLKADFEEVPPKVAKLIRSKAYRTVSSEVYDEPPEGIAGSGKMLRRVAFLGGEIPQIKSLDDIPAPVEHAERTNKHTRVKLSLRDLRSGPTDGAYTVFCEVRRTKVIRPKNKVNRFNEVTKMAGLPPDQLKAMFAKVDAAGGKRHSGAGIGKKKKGVANKHYTKSSMKNKWAEETPMDRAAMLKKLEDNGFDVSKITDAVPDEVLGEMLAQYEEGDAGDGDGADAQDHADDADADADDKDKDAVAANAEGDEDDEDKDEGMAAMADDEIDAMPDDKKKAEAYAAKARAYADRASMYSGFADIEGEPDEDDKEKAVTHAELPGLISRIVSAVRTDARKSINDMKRFAREEVNSRKRSAIEAFCEEMLKDGKLAPHELDESDPKIAHLSLRQRLLRADSRNVIRKFSEHGKTIEQTDLDLQMEEIRRRRPHSFAERVRTIMGGTPEDAEIAKIDAHFERFSENFKKVGMTKDNLIAGFKSNRKRETSLTANEYLRIPA